MSYEAELKFSEAGPDSCKAGLWVHVMHVMQGWMHHLARHAVACFLTRGDLYCPWTAGRDVFDRLLIDDDWSINNANWMWLSASAFFYQYHRVYSPATFGKKYDPNGNFVRQFVPELKVCIVSCVSARLTQLHHYYVNPQQPSCHYAGGGGERGDRGFQLK